MDNKHFCSNCLALAVGYLLLHCVHVGRAAKGLPAKAVTQAHGKGEWKLLMKTTGVVAMHMALTTQNTVIMVDRWGSAGYRLHRRNHGTRCWNNRQDLKDPTCYAHSVEYNVARNKIRPLHIASDTWCSSGSLLSDGTLIQTGGFGEGSRLIRSFKSCGNGHCDWRLERSQLSDDRWYSSNLRLPEKDDRVIIVGGKDVFSYEFVPKRSHDEGAYDLPLLQKTYQKSEGGNNLYPFVHLSSDGNIFIFANRESILFDYKRNRVVKYYPRMPGKGSRSYPSTGSSVILPLSHKNNFTKVEAMICGGAAPGAYSAARQGRYIKGLNSCGRMVITGNDPVWKMETMPSPRLMSDMIVLPNGHVLIINGVKHGAAGWKLASHPAYDPFLYKPKRLHGERFSILRPTNIARMYHSSAILLPDGRVLVGGSNPNNKYVFRKVAHPTELRLQAFTPPHMAMAFDHMRPHNVSIYTSRDDITVGYGEEFSVRFRLKNANKKGKQKKKKGRTAAGAASGRKVMFTAYAPPFNTHSISMNQRLLILRCKHMVQTQDGWMDALLEGPPSPRVAPSGHYLLTVVNDGIPGTSLWIKFLQD